MNIPFFAAPTLSPAAGESVAAAAVAVEGISVPAGVGAGGGAPTEAPVFSDLLQGQGATAAGGEASPAGAAVEDPQMAIDQDAAVEETDGVASWFATSAESVVVPSARWTWNMPTGGGATEEPADGDISDSSEEETDAEVSDTGAETPQPTRTAKSAGLCQPRSRCGNAVPNSEVSGADPAEQATAAASIVVADGMETESTEADTEQTAEDAKMPKQGAPELAALAVDGAIAPPISFSPTDADGRAPSVDQSAVDNGETLLPTPDEVAVTRSDWSADDVVSIASVRSHIEPEKMEAPITATAAAVSETRSFSPTFEDTVPDGATERPVRVVSLQMATVAAPESGLDEADRPVMTVRAVPEESTGATATGSATAAGLGTVGARTSIGGQPLALADARSLVRSQFGENPDGMAPSESATSSVSTVPVAPTSQAAAAAPESLLAAGTENAAMLSSALGKRGGSANVLGNAKLAMETIAAAEVNAMVKPLPAADSDATTESDAGGGAFPPEASGDEAESAETSAATVRNAREILAAPTGRGSPMGRSTSSTGGGRNFQSTDKQPVMDAAAASGTRVARTAENMSAQTTAMLAETELSDTSSWENGLRPVMELMAAGSERTGGVETSRPTDLGTVRSFAAASVREMLDAVERSREGNHTRFELKLETRDNEEVSVRVQWRDGVVHARFVTQTPALRDALAREWQAVSPTLAEKGIRFAEPTFEQRDSGGSTQSQSGSSYGQQERQPSSSSSDAESGTPRSFSARLAEARQSGRTTTTTGTISSVVTESSVPGAATSGSLRAWA